MSSEQMIFAVPEEFSHDRLNSLLAGDMDVTMEVLEDTQRFYLDTFDWRLFKANMVLEAEVRGGSCTLIWRELGSGYQLQCRSVRKLPKSAADFHNAGLQPNLKRILGRRTLLPQASMHGTVTRFRLRDDLAKSVMRVELRSDKVIGSDPPSYLHLKEYLCSFPYRGYEKIFDKRMRKLKKKLPLRSVVTDPIIVALGALGIRPGEYEARPRFVLEQEQPSSLALGQILNRYFHNMECNVQGAREDVDPEHLHDFLVALRRIRSILQRFARVLPDGGQKAIRRDMQWLEHATTGIRDLDIFMTLFDEFSNVVDAGHREALNSLYSFLAGEKKEGMWSMRISLESTRYMKLMSDLNEFISSCQDHNQSKLSKTQIKVAASDVIMEIYSELRIQAKKLSKGSNTDRLLTLFQTSKQLGYHMDIFQSLFPSVEMGELLEAKKVLQSRLNRFRDMDLQHRRLKSYKAGMAEAQGHIEISMEALEQLIEDRKYEKRSARNRALDEIGLFTRKKMNKRFKALFAN